MDNVFVTVFLFCFSLLPMAYLRYYPFRIIATLREQRILIAGHLIIFVVEFLLVTALFVSGLAPMQGSAVFCQADFPFFVVGIPHRHRGKIPTFSGPCQEAGSTTASCRMRACSIR